LQYVPRIRLASHEAEDVTKQRLLMLGQQQDKLFGAWDRFRTHERGSPVFPRISL
jgi:hypothetical protein